MKVERNNMNENMKDILFEKGKIDGNESEFRNKVNAACSLGLVLLFSVLLILKTSDPIVSSSAEIVLSFAIINFLIQQSYHSKHRNIWLFFTVMPIALAVISFVNIILSK